MPKRKMDHPFEVGQTYRNRNGDYVVLELGPPKMRVRFENGTERQLDIAMQARILENMQTEEAGSRQNSPSRHREKPPNDAGTRTHASTSPEIDAIIACLDKHVEQTGMKPLSPKEANALLAREGLLPDTSTRPGLPLRKLLRNRAIPHAYQDPPGKNGHWFIPHSNRAKLGNQSSAGVDSADVAGPEPNQAENTLTPRDAEFEAIRAAYRPDPVKVVFVGESRPAGGTFFYNGDSLLAAATRAAFETACSRSFRDTGEFLSFFKLQGCYLDDLCLTPVNAMDDGRREAERVAAEPALAQRLQVSAPATIIVVMKAIDGYVAAAQERAGLNAVPRHALPFPNAYHRAEYVKQLAALLRHLQSLGVLAEA